MNGKDPITKFLKRKRAIARMLTDAERVTPEQMFEDPKGNDLKFLQTLEDKLENYLTMKEHAEAAAEAVRVARAEATAEGNNPDDVPDPPPIPSPIPITADIIDELDPTVQK